MSVEDYMLDRMQERLDEIEKRREENYKMDKKKRIEENERKQLFFQHNSASSLGLSGTPDGHLSINHRNRGIRVVVRSVESREEAREKREQLANSYKKQKELATRTEIHNLLMSAFEIRRSKNWSKCTLTVTQVPYGRSMSNSLIVFLDPNGETLYEGSHDGELVKSFRHGPWVERLKEDVKKAEEKRQKQQQKKLLEVERAKAAQIERQEQEALHYKQAIQEQIKKFSDIDF